MKLLAVRERGRGASSQIRIVGIAPTGWAGKRVDVRYGARRIGRTSVRRDGTIQLTVRRPSGSRNGAYRLAVGRALSNRMKVSRGSAVPTASAACR